MPQIINTNAMSLVAQNNLNKSQAALGTAIERLSSGLRINSAKDDAAGQAISNRFTANINGLTQASRNANDGISLAQTTEGALNEINDNLQNIRRLSVQAANGTNSESDRQSIQDEINQRLAEINRVSQQTEFNGIKVLSKDQTLSIQVGANDGQTIDINLGKMDTETLGLDGFNIMNMVAASQVTSGMQVTGGANADIKYNLSKEDVGELEKNLFGDGNTGKMYAYAAADGTTAFIGVDKDGNWSATTATVTAAKEGTPAVVDGDGKETTPAVPATPASIAFGTKVDQAAFTDAQKAVVTSLETLQTMDDALAKVDAMRSGLGASQNRFNSVISNLDNTVINLSESRARILDADFAVEVSNMSRANILQSAGTTVLAQANQVPQNVLTLLR
ncbi:FliC/FljB family flagellin [Morganella morganii]|uniref:FliC/FljB family flagellin n=2 Tax=Morganella morganii TaxID=582 RepID=UPI0021CE4239|nr:FliC/FljB family flagellin [Morganella morganii]MCU6224205.1 FliC/FljB family flagellin [Morganella morganii]